MIEPEPSRDHTERLLARAGVRITRDGDRISLTQHDELELGDIHVPGDPSSAAFHIAAAILVKGSRIVITDMSANWTRTGFVRIAERMGAVVIGDLETPGPDEIATEEPVCELDVAAGPLVGTTVEPHEVPLAIDELPLVALLGCFAEGETVVTGAAGAQASRSPTGSRPSSTACAASAPTSRPPTTASSSAAPAACAAARSRPTATTAWRCSARSPAWPAARASRSIGMDAAAVSYPGFERDLAGLSH